MTEEQNILLAQLVGICWHEYPKGLIDPQQIFSSHCRFCGCQFGMFDDSGDLDSILDSMKFNTNPDFATPEGFELLRRAMCDKGEWSNFFRSDLICFAETSHKTPEDYLVFSNKSWMYLAPSDWAQMLAIYLSFKDQQ